MRRTSDRGSLSSRTRREGKYNSFRTSSRTRSLMDALSTQTSFTQRSQKESQRDQWSSSWRTREGSRRRWARRTRTWRHRLTMTTSQHSIQTLMRLQGGSLKRRWLIGKISQLMRDCMIWTSRRYRNMLRMCSTKTRTSSHRLKYHTWMPMPLPHKAMCLLLSVIEQPWTRLCMRMRDGDRRRTNLRR